MLKDWDACAREVGRALSRYDGYSTYAKLESIISIPASPMFDKNSSCHVADIVARAIESEGGGRPGYIENRVKHAISLGLLERAIPGGRAADAVVFPRREMKRIGIGGKVELVAIPGRHERKGRAGPLDDKEAKMSNAAMKVALSPMGRACRAAIRMDDEEFRNFLATRILLDRDFDMCGLMLECALKNEKGEIVGEEFSREIAELLQQRKGWLEAMNNSSPIVADRVRNHVQWASPRRELGEVSVRHHLRMRRQWAASLGHLDQSRRFLTDEGRALARQIRSAIGRNGMFWLAPSPECAQKMGIDSVNSDAVCSAWDMLRCSEPAAAPGPRMIEQTAAFMKSAFQWMRMSVLAQAPLASVIPYVYFLETRFNERVGDMRDFFADILRKHRDIHCVLRGVLEDTQYRLLEQGGR